MGWVYAIFSLLQEDEELQGQGQEVSIDWALLGARHCVGLHQFVFTDSSQEAYEVRLILPARCSRKSSQGESWPKVTQLSVLDLGCCYILCSYLQPRCLQVVWATAMVGTGKTPGAGGRSVRMGSWTLWPQSEPDGSVALQRESLSSVLVASGRSREASGSGLLIIIN